MWTYGSYATFRFWLRKKTSAGLPRSSGSAQPALKSSNPPAGRGPWVTLFGRHARSANLTAMTSMLLERVTFLLRYVEQTKLKDLASKLGHTPRTRRPQPPTRVFRHCWWGLHRRLRERYPEIYLKIIETFQPVLQRSTDPWPGRSRDRQRTDFLTGFRGNPAVLGRDLVRSCHSTRRGSAVSGSTCGVCSMAFLSILTGVQKSGIRLELETAAPLRALT